ncbi:MAG: cytochrome c [Nitrospirota bacterium]
MRVVLMVAAATASCVVALCGCSQPKLIPDAQVVAPQTSSSAATAITLPVSLNAVMVALVDHASEPLWVDAYKNPTTEARWRESEYDAYQMAVSGKLIQLAGTGPSDADWVSQPEWKDYADELSAAGMEALKASQAKDVKALGAAGDRLVAACETCHKKFKPDLTSMGIYKSPSYPGK